MRKACLRFFSRPTKNLVVYAAFSAVSADHLASRIMDSIQPLIVTHITEDTVLYATEDAVYSPSFSFFPVEVKVSVQGATYVIELTWVGESVTPDKTLRAVLPSSKMTSGHVKAIARRFFEHHGVGNVR